MNSEMICPAANGQSFEKVYFRLKGAIERYAFYLMGTKNNAEDVSQEVFIKVWINWDRLKYRDISVLEDFIYAIARNHLLNEIRRKNQKGRKGLKKHLEGQPHWNLHDETLIVEGLGIYRDAINRLPTQEKLVYLFYQDDYKTVEIANRFGRSVHTIKNQLRSAQISVREYLNKSFDLNFQRKRTWKKESLN